MEDSSELLARLSRVLFQRLESLQRSGVATLGKSNANVLPAEILQPAAAPRPAASGPVESRFVMKPSTLAPSSPPVAAPAQDSISMPRAKTTASPASPTKTIESVKNSTPVQPVAVGQRAEALAALACEVAGCKLCKDLAKTRTQTVFGVGNTKPRVVFFGEAPGADEDRQGEPFVGRAGQLLTKIIEACTFKREDVYIMNVLKCRPPENRTPVDEEIENCRPFFEQQLGILQPEYIVCAGATPMKALFGTKKSVGQMRGTFHEFRGAKVVITYHPAYLLRNPDAKRFVWDDMKMLLADMGIPLPKSS
jgi:DNA polymerase